MLIVSGRGNNILARNWKTLGKGRTELGEECATSVLRRMMCGLAVGIHTALYPVFIMQTQAEDEDCKFVLFRC